MTRFSFEPGQDGVSRLAVCINGVPVQKPFLSPCGTHLVDPREAYGVPNVLARAIDIVNAHVEGWRKRDEAIAQRIANRFCDLLAIFFSKDDLKDAQATMERQAPSDRQLHGQQVFPMDVDELMLRAARHAGAQYGKCDTEYYLQLAWEIAFKQGFLRKLEEKGVEGCE